ncbi:hypothetical protein [Streptomyces venezuelae]|uniref:hypothetical protein n=1 Tax=Streptomyces venezuelae TaxID=54571 RepID=UPI00168D7CBB|nr:hypothetical protein [Streptomyces venezuelae]
MTTQQEPDRADRRDETEGRHETDADHETEADHGTHVDHETEADHGTHVDHETEADHGTHVDHETDAHETDPRYEPDAPEGADEPLPRDPQNQQAEQGEDPLAIPVPDWPDSAAPEVDVAGSGRRDDAHDAQHENPDVDEPVD